MRANESNFVPTRADTERYLALRAASRRLSDLLVATIPPEVLNVVAEQLGIRAGDGAIHLANEEVGALLMDTCIHGWPVGGKTVLESFRQRVVETRRPRLSGPERRLLDAQVDVVHSVFQIKRVVPGTGVHVEDGLTDDAFFLMDTSMSRDPDAVGCWVSARLITIGAWKMTTGAPIVLGMLSARQVRGTLHHFFEGVGDSDEARCAVAMALAAWSIDVTLGPRALPPSEERLPHRAAKRPGRNQPCPCGSGLKAKRCCGA